jgi:hypothetical protein
LANLIIHTAEQQMGDPFRLLNQGASDRQLDESIKLGDETLSKCHSNHMSWQLSVSLAAL